MANNTKLWDWFEAVDADNLSVQQLNKLYTKWFIIALFAIMVPIMISAFLNVKEWNGGIMIVLAIATLACIWVLLHPIIAAIRGVGEINSGPGGAAKKISTAMYQAIVCLTLGSPIAHLLLILFPLDGHGKTVLTALVMVPLVVVGTVWFSKGDWVIRKFWHLYTLILLGCVAYWSITSFFPGIQGSEASSVALETHQSVQAQNNRYLTKKVKEIKERINGMHESLSLDERVKTLSLADQKIWADSTQSSFASRSTEASKPVIKEAYNSAKAEALKAWHGEELTFHVVISPKGVPQPEAICQTLPVGDYKISVRDVIAPSILDDKGDDMGVFDLSNTGRPGTQFGITVNGKRIGETVAVLNKDDCLTIAVSMNGPTRAFFENGSKYSYIGEAAPAATLVLTR